jgi:ATF/CREB family transcription factor
VKQPPDGVRDSKPAGANADSGTQPLAPPPRPNQEGNESSSDYFANQHKSSHYSLEPNLFEQSFGKPPETPGKSILPPVASLTSPAPLTGNASLGGGYDWSGSLRSGPLSPAMLSGPTGPGDYFDSSLRGSFPTPNESSLRTGLTPGGGGSMFPAPSPNSQALFQSLASGGATPSTLDFHRTAMNAAAASKSEQSIASISNRSASTTAATTSETMNATAAPASASNANFANHDNEAANGLYLLAQAGNESQANHHQFAVPNQPAGGDKSNKRGRAAGAQAPAQPPSSEGADDSEGESKPNSKKSKKNNPAKGNKGKKEELPKSASKRAKSNASSNGMDPDDDMMDDDDMDGPEHSGGKKMTDEEKRKNFLERNRYVMWTIIRHSMLISVVLRP